MCARLVAGACLLLAGLLASDAGEAQTAAPARTVVVLDSSLAMSGPLDGYRKYYLLRKALQAALASPAPGLELGLVAYGHRQRAACNDVEVLRPVEPVDALAYLHTAFSFKPRGKAPIEAALRAAAAATGSDPANPVRLLLIAASGDTCEADPCAAAAAIVAQSPGMWIDVLALDADEPGAVQLKCVAEKGHGRLLAPATLDETTARLTELLAPGAAAPQPAPTAQPIAGKSGLRLSAHLSPGGPEPQQPVAWSVRAIQASGTPGAPVFQVLSTATSVELPAGKYQVEAALAGIRKSITVDVAAEGTSDAAISLDAAPLHLGVISSKAGDDLSDVYLTVYRVAGQGDTGAPAATVAVEHSPKASLLLPAGTYRALAERGGVRFERTVTLEAGKEASEDISVDVGTLAIELRAPDGSLSSDAAFYFISEDDPEAATGQRDVARSAAQLPQFQLPAGVYHVLARLGGGAVRQDVTVKSGETTRVVLSGANATLQVKTEAPWAGAELPQLVSYSVARLDAGASAPAAVVRTALPDPQLVLQAGQYRVTALMGPVNVRASADVVLRPGRSEHVTLTPAAGLLDLRFGDDPTHAFDLLWEIRDADGTRIWSTAAATPSVPLAPGTYEVRVYQRAQVHSMDVTVHDKERQTIAIPPN